VIGIEEEMAIIADTRQYTLRHNATDRQKKGVISTEARQHHKKI
jgi:hypothetical protein